MKILDRSFFNGDTLTVARRLLGTKLVRAYNRRILSGVIVETEAYLGAGDSASHAFRGKTPRNRVMFGPSGCAYVYFVYGMHYMLNIVTEGEGTPGAVLVRAMAPVEGHDCMESNRGRKGKDLTDGPAKLCRALAIDKALNGWDLTAGKKLWLERYQKIPTASIRCGPRIGIHYAQPEDRTAPRRFWLPRDQRFSWGQQRVKGND